MNMEGMNMESEDHSKRGSVLIIVMFLGFVMAGVIGSYLMITVAEFKRSDDTVTSNAVLTLAEAAAEEAIWALNHVDWNNWNDFTDDKGRELTGFDLGEGRDGSVKVVVEDFSTLNPIIYVEATSNSPSGRSVTKQVEVKLAPRGLIANGLTARTTIHFDAESDKNKDGATMDSYDSSAGDYDPLLNRGDKATIAAPLVTATLGSAEIYGYAATDGTTPNVGAAGRIYGPYTDPSVQLDPNRMTGDFFEDFKDIGNPTFSSPQSQLPGGPNWPKTIGNVGGAPIKEYELTDLTVGIGEELIIQGPVRMVVDNDMNVTGKITVTSTGRVEFFVGGDLVLDGLGLDNQSWYPDRAFFYGTNTVPGQKFWRIRSSNTLVGGIYAPNAVVKFSGDKTKDKDLLVGKDKDVHLYGGVVGHYIELSGYTAFHYDEQLDYHPAPDQLVFKLLSWRQLSDLTDRYDFSTYFP